MIDITETSDGLTFGVKAVPGSSRTRIAGQWQSLLKVTIAAAPEKGKANKELIKYFSKTLGISKSSISIVNGLHDPKKIVQVTNITKNELIVILKDLLVS
ncbi:MAG: DUF167 domain-containing protein [Phycisphaerae bacterium]|nr:DUF167 domain-containing protein [Phycisphaerae bacterium]